MRFLTDPIWWFFLFWLPDFFSKHFGYNIKESALPLPENYSITWTDMSYQERQNDGKIVLLMGMAPVSYTHLDVYKRQIQIPSSSA